MPRESMHTRIDSDLKTRFENLLKDSSGNIPYAKQSRVVESLIREYCRVREEKNAQGGENEQR